LAAALIAVLFDFERSNKKKKKYKSSHIPFCYTILPGQKGK
jgi:hypothetical protein